MILFPVIIKVDFGSVIFPENVSPPQPVKVGGFKRLAHGLRSSDVTLLDMKTFYISDLHYDGSAPDAFFWVGTGPEPNAQGVKVPNELNESVPTFFKYFYALNSITIQPKLIFFPIKLSKIQN